MNSLVRSPLRIAFLGADATTPALAEAAVECSIVAGTCEIDAADSQAALPLRAAARFDSWEALLDRGAVDAVVVARGADQDLRAEQLRKLIQAGVPVLVAHPVVDSMVVYYELDMIRRDSGSVVVPNLPLRRHPAAADLAAMVRQGEQSPIGRVEQLLVQCELAEPSQAEVANRFSRQIDLARFIVGELMQLGAMIGTPNDVRWSSLGLQLTGTGGVAVRWSVEPGQSDGAMHLRLLGSRGRAELAVSNDQRNWTLAVHSSPPQVREYPAWNPARAALDELAEAVDGQAYSPDWVDAARCVELTETIPRSLKKGRTIELYYEDYTEESTFKGLMASLGCGLLLAAMACLLVVGLAEKMDFQFVGVWPRVMLGLFFVFLLLQSLMLVFRPRTPVAKKESP